jgi:hypothetical protein
MVKAGAAAAGDRRSRGGHAADPRLGGAGGVRRRDGAAVPRVLAGRHVDARHGQPGAELLRAELLHGVRAGFHRFPYWNPLLFGGLPFVEGMHGDIFYPPSLAMFFLDARAMWGWKMALHIFLAGIFTYLWLRRGLGWTGCRRSSAGWSS